METGGFYQGFLQSLAVRRPIRRCLCQRLIRTAGDPVVIAGPKGLISEELGISQPSYCKLHCSSSSVGWFQAAWWSDVMLWPLRYLALRVKSQDSRPNFIHRLICVVFFFYYFLFDLRKHMTTIGCYYVCAYMYVIIICVCAPATGSSYLHSPLFLYIYFQLWVYQFIAQQPTSHIAQPIIVVYHLCIYI